MKKPNFPSHFRLSHLPTPILTFKNLSIPSAYNLSIKRDDFTGIEFSGNKIRKLDFLLKDAVKNKAKRIVTCGGVQSNHCRATALAASRLGLKCSLVLKGVAPKQITGNFLLSKMSGADITFVTEEAYQNSAAIMQAIADENDGPAYIIPEGGSNEVGAWGYVKCFFEILDQLEQKHTKIDTIVVATGSGGTHAGLLAGKLLAQSAIEIISINVCDDAAFFINKIDGILHDFSTRYNLPLKYNRADIKIIDGFVGAGYGQVSGWEEKQLLKFVSNEGIVFDPVYGIKACAGMLSLMGQNKLPGKNILFIHTGGIFGVFPFSEQLKPFFI